jgi:hypothetical protein
VSEHNRPFVKEDLEAIFFHRPPLLKSREARGAAMLEALGRGLGTLLRRQGHRNPKGALARDAGDDGQWARDHLLRGLLMSGVEVTDHQAVDAKALEELKSSARGRAISFLVVFQDHPDGDGVQLNLIFLGEELAEATEKALIQCVDEMRYLAEPGTLTVADAR